MIRVRALVGVAVAAFAVAGAAPAQQALPKPDEMVNTPPFQHWSSFPVGTRVTQKQVVTLPDGAKLEQVIVQKLLEKTPERITVETVVTDNSKYITERTRAVTTYPPTIRMDQVSASSPDAAVTEGKEELVVKGKKIATEWVEAVTKSGDDVWREKTWTAQEIPGGIVKETLVHERGGKVVSESTLELVDFKLGS